MDVLLFILLKMSVTVYFCRSQGLRGLRRGSEEARLVGLWVRISPDA